MESIKKQSDSESEEDEESKNLTKVLEKKVYDKL